MTPAWLAEHIRRIVDQAPELSEAQASRLTLLLADHPAGDSRAAATAA